MHDDDKPDPWKAPGAIPSAVIAGVLLVAATLLPVYDWFIGIRTLPLIGIAVGLPICGYYAVRAHDNGQGTQMVWLSAAVIALSVTGGVAALDANKWTYHRCWTIAGTDTTTEVIECAPGHSTPDRGNDYICNQTSTSSSGGTIWRCRYTGGE